MAEYIERDKVLEKLRYVEEATYSHSGFYRGMRHFDAVSASDIKTIPAADVAPVVHGKWEFPTMFGYRAFHIPHCSVCGGVPCGVDENTKFCPNCGARMDGE